MATTTVAVDPTVQPLQLGYSMLARAAGQRTPRVARGDSHSPW